MKEADITIDIAKIQKIKEYNEHLIQFILKFDNLRVTKQSSYYQIKKTIWFFNEENIIWQSSTFIEDKNF